MRWFCLAVFVVRGIQAFLLNGGVMLNGRFACFYGIEERRGKK
jgi:hypothetical protein